MGNDHDGEEKDDVPAPTYGDYQVSIYLKGMVEGVRPEITTDPNLLREQAKKKMRPEAYNYIAGGAGEGATMAANRLAFRQWKIIPRMLRPTGPRNLRVKLFGQTYETPILQAPVGVQSVYHPDRELGTAKACAELKVPFTMSTASSSTIQEVSKTISEHNGPKPWFQLYWPQDDDVTASILSTARNAGFAALVVTLDTASMSWRPADLDGGFLPFAAGEGNAVGFSDPVFRRKFAASIGDDDASTAVEENTLLVSRYWLSLAFPGNQNRRTWTDLALLRKHWDGPILLKGIQDVRDAEMAVSLVPTGVIDGIIVSNHGGRQCDGAVGSLDQLAEIAEKVGDRIPVLFDSGVRTGADIVKALSLGARAVFVGRPTMYGLGIGGWQGARHVLACLLADLDQTMGLMGVGSVGELGRGNLKRVLYSGDVRSSL